MLKHVAVCDYHVLKNFRIHELKLALKLLVIQIFSGQYETTFEPFKKIRLKIYVVFLNGSNVLLKQRIITSNITQEIISTTESLNLK